MFVSYSDLGQAAADWSVYDAMMEQAIRYSLLERDPATKTLAVHRLVQDVLRDGMDEAARRTWAERAVRAVSRAFPYVEFSNWPECDRLLPHALACAQAIQAEGLEFDAAARLLNQAGYYLLQRGQYWQPEPLFRQALEIYQRVLGKEHPDTLGSQNNLAELYKSQGRYGEAEPLYQETLEICQRVLGKEHPDTLRSQNNLATLYFSQERFGEAEPLLRQTATVAERIFPSAHPTVATYLENHAAVLEALGRMDEAEAQAERAAAMRAAHARQEGRDR